MLNTKNYITFLRKYYGVPTSISFRRKIISKSYYLTDGGMLKRICPIGGVNEAHVGKRKIAKLVEVMGWEAVGAKLVDYSKPVEMEGEVRRGASGSRK